MYSVRRVKLELRKNTGSEPMKFMEVAEYRSLPVGQDTSDEAKFLRIH